MAQAAYTAKLEKAGIPTVLIVFADQVEAASHGENELLVPTPDNIHEPENRRVEVLVR